MDKSKSFVRITIIAMLIIGMLTTTILATKVTITADTLKLRKEPSLDSAIIELLSQNEKYEVIEELESWYKIKYKDTEGYISKEYAKKDGDNVTIDNTVKNEVSNSTNNTKTNEINTNTNTENTNEHQEKNKVAIEDVDVRISPLVNSCIIKKLKKDTEVEIISSVRGWDYIDVEDYCGWVRSEKLKGKEISTTAKETTPEVTVVDEKNVVENEPKAEEQPVAVNEKIYDKTKRMYVKPSSINVREKPDKSSNVVETATQNIEVIVKGESGEWYKVDIAGKEGYILKSLLTNQKNETTSRSTNIDRTKTTENSKQKEENTNTDKKTTVNATGSSKGAELVSIAKQYLGCKYVYGAAGPKTFDCSGFTLFLYNKYGVSLPHSATSQSYKGVYVSKENLAPGDLVIFNNGANKAIGHVGVYIGGNQFIHASSGKGKVIISSLSDSYYSARYNTARRIF